MTTLCFITSTTLVAICGMAFAQAPKEQADKSLNGEFVIREIVKDTEKAMGFYPAASPFVGKMFVLKVEFIGKAPKWFGAQPRWVQSLESPGRIEVGSRFRGEVHYDSKFGFHFSCFSPVQIYLKEAEQTGADQPATVPKSKPESKDKPLPESKLAPR